MKVRLTVKDTRGLYPLSRDMSLTCEDYSWHVYGGPEEATISVSGPNKNMADLLFTLRCGIEILDDDGVPLWWGFVNRVEIPVGKVRIIADLEEMANKVALAYTLTNFGGTNTGVRRTSPWYSDQSSVERYGSKELLDTGTDLNVVAADAIARRELEEMKNPVGYVVRESGGGSVARLSCKGWWQTTSWQYAKVDTKLALSYQGTSAAEYQLTSTQIKVAQSFKATSDFNLVEIAVYIAKHGTPGELSLELLEYFDDNTPGEVLASTTIAAEFMGGEAAWVRGYLSSPFAAEAGGRYFLAMSCGACDVDNFYKVTLDSSRGYPEGTFRINVESGWQAVTGDMPFQLNRNTLAIQNAGMDATFKRLNNLIDGYAQQVELITAIAIAEVGVYLRRVGDPGQLSVRLMTDSDPGVQIATAKIESVAVGTAFAWKRSLFDLITSQPIGKVWLSLSAEQADATNYYEFQVDGAQGYGGGIAYQKTVESGTWSALAADVPFEIYKPTISHQFATIGSVIGELGFVWPMIAQKVVPPSAITLTSVGLYVKKVGQPGSIRVDVCRNLGDLPGEVLGGGTLPEDMVSGEAGFRVAALESPIVLPQDASGYFLVLSVAGASEISYYEVVLDGAGGYAAGFALCKTGEAWAEGAGDMPFRLYANELVETSQQIQNLITSYAQFLKRVFVENKSGIATESYRSGDTTAFEELESLLEIGTSNYRRLLCRVDIDRSVWIWEQPAAGNELIQMWSDGKLHYRDGGLLEQHRNPVGKWINTENVISRANHLGVLTGLQSFFCERAQWNADGEITVYPANWKNPYSVRVQNG